MLLINKLREFLMGSPKLKKYILNDFVYTLYLYQSPTIIYTLIHRTVRISILFLIKIIQQIKNLIFFFFFIGFVTKTLYQRLLNNNFHFFPFSVTKFIYNIIYLIYVLYCL
jgi:hypothetical protein